MRVLGRITASAVKPGVWPVVIIEAGTSLNGITYPAGVLREASERGMFEGRPAASYRKVDASGQPIEDHVAEAMVGLSVRNTVGAFRSTRWSEADQAVVGELHLSLGKAEADLLNADLVAHAENGNLDIPGLSIDGWADVDELTRECRAIEGIAEVTVVTHPSAGGRFVGHRIAASVRGDTMFDKILRRLRETYPSIIGAYLGPKDEGYLQRHIARRLTESADVREACVTALREGKKAWPTLAQAIGDPGKRLVEGVDMLAALDDAALLVNMVREEIQKREAKALTNPEAEPPTPSAEPDPAPDPAPPPAPVQESRTGQPAPDPQAREDAEYLRQRAQQERVRESQQFVREACREAELADAVADTLVQQVAGQILTRESARDMAQRQRRIIDGAIRESATGRSIEIVSEPEEKLTNVLAHMLNPQQVRIEESEGDAPWMHSFNEFLMRHFVRRNPRLREAQMSHSQSDIRTARRIREAVDSTNFDQVFADALDRSVLAAYEGHIDWANWRKLVRMVPYSDFRTHRIINIGYYGNLPTVDKGAPYTQMTTPTDREETIALAKKGGLETITLEDMLNDDLQLWQTLIQRLGQAAMETAHNTVLALIRDATQPTMTDSKTLTDQTRSPVNEGTAALLADATGKTNFVNSIIAMMKQTGGSGQRKGIIPKFAVIPFEKMEAFAYVVNQLTGGNTGSDVDQLMKLFGIAIPEAVIDWGTTNAKDWYLLADPLRAEVLRFATLNGRDTPEVFIADDGRFGSLFTNDQIELKERFIFAAAAVDYAGIYGNDAAS